LHLSFLSNQYLRGNLNGKSFGSLKVFYKRDILKNITSRVSESLEEISFEFSKSNLEVVLHLNELDRLGSQIGSFHEYDQI
jgi:hypothetical protein